MPDITQEQFDLTPLPRMGAAFAIAFLSASEAAILTAPATFYLRRQAKPVGEFDGVAAFGAMVVVAAVVAVVVFIGMFAFVAKRRKTAGWITRLGWTLCAALAVVLITLPIARPQDALLWADGLSLTVLAIGLVWVFRGGEAGSSEE